MSVQAAHELVTVRSFIFHSRLKAQIFLCWYFLVDQAACFATCVISNFILFLSAKSTSRSNMGLAVGGSMSYPPRHFSRRGDTQPSNVSRILNSGWVRDFTYPLRWMFKQNNSINIHGTSINSEECLYHSIKYHLI